MTIDERLEALTQSVELMAGMQKDNDAQLSQVIKAIAADGEHIRALARIVEAHEHRLTDLEGGAR